MKINIVTDAQSLNEQLSIIEERTRELNQIIEAKIRVIKKKPDFTAGDLVNEILPIAETVEEVAYVAFQIGTVQKGMQGKESVVDTILDTISLRGFKR